MSAVMEHPALAEVYSRAGASDKNRELWLRERHGGLTATQLRELYLQGAGYKARLIKEKVNLINEPWVGNRYTAWGNTREPIIAEWVRQRFAIEPESRVFRAADNPRFLASPDGIGVAWDGTLIIDEIKTGKDDLRPGGEACIRKGYLLQMQWGMRVTGARRCLYAWEQHNSDWQDRGGSFEEPLPINDEPSWQWIEYDEALVAELEAIAVDFLSDLDAALRDAADGVAPLIDAELDTLGFNYLRFITLEKEATESKKDVWQKMLDRLSGCDALSQEGAVARVTYNPGSVTESEVLDAEAAKQADPELFAEVQALSKRWNEHAAQFKKSVSSTGKPTLRVTEIKSKDMKS